MAIKVSQAVIDEIKKKGMGSAISHANSGNASAEFTEGAKRMYGNRVSGRNTGEKNQAVKSNSADKAKEPKEVKMPPSAPAAATRRTGGASTPHGNMTVEEVVAMRSKGKKSNNSSRLNRALERKNAPVTGASTPTNKPVEQVIAERNAGKKSKSKKSTAWQRAAR